MHAPWKLPDYFIGIDTTGRSLWPVSLSTPSGPLEPLGTIWSDGPGNGAIAWPFPAAPARRFDGWRAAVDWLAAWWEFSPVMPRDAGALAKLEQVFAVQNLPNYNR